jgi:TolA-binding protein
LRVLNSYWVGSDSTYKFYEVIELFCVCFKFRRLNFDQKHSFNDFVFKQNKNNKKGNSIGSNAQGDSSRPQSQLDMQLGDEAQRVERLDVGGQELERNGKRTRLQQDDRKLATCQLEEETTIAIAPKAIELVLLHIVEIIKRLFICLHG